MVTATLPRPVIFDKSGNPIEITPESATPTSYAEAENAIRPLREKYSHLIDIDRFLAEKKAEELREGQK